jgi:hypothetical protein
MFSRKEGMKGSDLVNDVIHLFVKIKTLLNILGGD